MLAAFVVAVKDDLTGQLKEGEKRIEVCGFRGILVCPGRKGLAVGGALSVECLSYKHSQCC